MRWTGAEVEEARRKLKRDTAEALGLVLMAQGYFERDLVLALVWSNDAADHDKLTMDLASANMWAKLGKARERAKEKYAPASEAFLAWTSWLDGSDAIRAERNRLIHSRWGFHASAGVAEAVLSIPSAAEVDSKKYSVVDLLAIAQRFEELSIELNKLRKRWPL